MGCHRLDGYTGVANNWKADRIHRVTGGSTKAMCKDSGCTDKEWGRLYCLGQQRAISGDYQQGLIH